MELKKKYNKPVLRRRRRRRPTILPARAPPDGQLANYQRRGCPVSDKFNFRTGLFQITPFRVRLAYRSTKRNIQTYQKKKTFEDCGGPPQIPYSRAPPS